MANTYDVGDLIRCSGAFTDASSVAVDPTVITFKFKNPSETITTYVFGVNAELVKDSVGNYHADVDVNDRGAWLYRFEGSGAVGQSAGETFFEARGPSL